LSNLQASGARFGIMDARNVTPTRWLVEGETISIGDLTFSVLHVPGHTPGHLVFANVPSRFALVGDTLFQGSVGRTDFEYGSHDELIAGIKGKLLPLGDDVTILPGHGAASTIGRERQTNPFLQN
jgi:glyoxylase-like metal-dependent hydrolase (beta-lactamase superfamily II)